MTKPVEGTYTKEVINGHHFYKGVNNENADKRSEFVLCVDGEYLTEKADKEGVAPASYLMSLMKEEHETAWSLQERFGINGVDGYDDGLNKIQLNTYNVFLQPIKNTLTEEILSFKVLMYKRGSKSGEDRLVDSFSVGIGGHINFLPEVITHETLDIARMETDKAEIKEELGLDVTKLSTFRLEGFFPKMIAVDWRECDDNNVRTVNSRHIGLVTAYVLPDNFSVSDIVPENGKIENVMMLSPEETFGFYVRGQQIEMDTNSCNRFQTVCMFEGKQVVVEPWSNYLLGVIANLNHTLQHEANIRVRNETAQKMQKELGNMKHLHSLVKFMEENEGKYFSAKQGVSLSSVEEVFQLDKDDKITDEEGKVVVDTDALVNLLNLAEVYPSYLSYIEAMNKTAYSEEQLCGFKHIISLENYVDNGGSFKIVDERTGAWWDKESVDGTMVDLLATIDFSTDVVIYEIDSSGNEGNVMVDNVGVKAMMTVTKHVYDSLQNEG